MSRLESFVRTGERRVYTDSPTAGSLWDCALGSDSGAEGIELLRGLDSTELATLTVVARSLAYASHRPYQGPQLCKVDVGGRVLYLAELGYSEGYLFALRATEGEAREAVPCSSGWSTIK